MGVPARVRASLWERSEPPRRVLRLLRREASVALHRLRRSAPRVVATATPASVATPHPAIVAPPGATEGQTETSFAPAAGAWLLDPGDGLDALPAATVESMLLAAAAEGLPWVSAGLAPAAVLGAPARLHLPRGRRPPRLLRLPRAGNVPAGPVLGRLLPHVTAAPCSRAEETPATRSSGAYRLDPRATDGSVFRWPLADVETALSGLPAENGPRTALFLLPFLAVGGAERLLFDLLAGLRDRYRLLVATVEPHRPELGQTVDRCRQLTPHVYTLGDWLPREAHPGALRHLVRRWQVESLLSWNGTVAFYDLLPELRRRKATPRILAQLYNHAGGWMDRTGPRTVREVDVHLAVNRRIADELVARGAAPESVRTIHHAVDVPQPLPEAERTRRRAERRRQLGLPEEAVVVGTFVRMHRQKRPLDVVRLARRMEGSGVHFLLVGGGPLDAILDRELGRRPMPHLIRLPMTDDPLPLYDAVDLVLLTSSYEGLPVLLLDGLARGIPCVATAVGEVPELLADGGGAVVPVGDLAAMERAVRGLLDPEARRTEGARGRAAVAARHSLGRYVAAYEEAIFPGPTPGQETRGAGGVGGGFSHRDQHVPGTTAPPGFRTEDGGPR